MPTPTPLQLAQASLGTEGVVSAHWGETPLGEPALVVETDDPSFTILLVDRPDGEERWLAAMAALGVDLAPAPGRVEVGG